MSMALHQPKFSSNDRITVAVLLALAFHALLILGISFDYEDLRKEKEALPSLEITFAYTAMDQKPDEADYLAQANQLGSGNTTEKTRPQSPPQAAPNPLPQPGNAQLTAPQEIVNNDEKPLNEEILAKEEETAPLTTGEEAPPEEAKLPSAAELMRRSLEMAKIESELNEITKIYSAKPKEKLLVPNSMSHVEAAYLDAWQRKVEIVGNMNYPQKAISENLTGDLLLMAAINEDGTLNRVEIWRSSGVKLLDDAAVRIVKQSAPYPPLPEGIRATTKILKIPRTWKFSIENTLSTQ